MRLLSPLIQNVDNLPNIQLSYIDRRLRTFQKPDSIRLGSQFLSHASQAHPRKYIRELLNLNPHSSTPQSLERESSVKDRERLKQRGDIGVDYSIGVEDAENGGEKQTA